MIPALLLAACAPEPFSVPEGPEPAFTVGEEFVAADDVLAELERGAALLILDARPPNDYALEHITGAFSTPFYEIEEHYPRVPEGVWAVAYCACPHSESGVVADYLREQGHEQVAVLDEGFLVWAERGYPTEAE